MARMIGPALLALLSGCGGDDPGGLTAEESRQLNEAAAMLDEAPQALPSAEENAEIGELPVTGEAATEQD